MDVITIGSVVVLIFLCDRLGVWLENRGWIYYRHKKASGSGGFGNALQELNAVLSPATAHVRQVKEKSSSQKIQRNDDGTFPPEFEQ